MGAEHIERLITLIENRGSLCGAAVVGQGSITFLFGHPHHASIAGLQVTGMDAVREIARMAASGAEPIWDETVRLGAGQSIDSVAVADILATIHQAADGASPGPASALEPYPPLEAAVAAHDSPHVTEEAAPQDPDGEVVHPPASDLARGAKSRSRRGRGVGHKVARGGAAGPLVDLPPADAIVAGSAPTNAGEPPVLDAPMTLAGGPEDVDAEAVEAPSETAIPAELEPGPAPPGATQGEELHSEQSGNHEPATADSSRPARVTTDPDSMPPLIAGESILDETSVTTVDLTSFLLEDAPLQVVYRSTNAQGVALIENGRVNDALYIGAGKALYGTAAFEFIVGAREGTVSIAKIPRGVFEALPACWSGQLTTPDTPAKEVESDDLNVGAVSTLGTAAIQITTRTDRGVVLYHGGKMVACYTHTAPHRLMNEGALGALYDDPSAFVRVRTLTTAPPPPPPTPEGIDQEEWAKTISAMTLAVQARLETHSGRVEAILQQTPPNRQGVAAAAQVIRSTVIRGVHPATMRSIADQIEAIGRARLPT